MSSEPVDSERTDPRERRTRAFRKYAPVIRQPPEQARRQNEVLRHAWRNFSEPALVMAFLNTHHEKVGGQPLQVALHSDEGLLRVERLLDEIAPRKP